METNPYRSFSLVRVNGPCRGVGGGEVGGGGGVFRGPFGLALTPFASPVF